jgi:hypothetical protein
MSKYTEAEIKKLPTPLLKIIVQPFFSAYLTATQVMAGWELYNRQLPKRPPMVSDRLIKMTLNSKYGVFGGDQS